MPIDVKIPALGESISSGVLSAWKISEGSYVEIDQPIYELETDKITQEGLAEVSGVISFLAKEGDEVEIGATIANIDESAENPNSSESTSKPQAQEPVIEGPAVTAAVPPESIVAPSPSLPSQDESDPKVDDSIPAPLPLSPAVRKILAETDIDPTTISGTGKDGRITKADVLAAKSAAPSPTVAPPSTPVNPPQAVPVTPASLDSRSTRRPLSPIRRKIASRLVEAQQTAAILSTFNEVDLSAIMALRKKHQDSFVKQNGVKLGFMSFFVKGVVHALRAVPQINARMEGNELVENHYFDIGVAVGTKKGLVVPVLRDCDQLGFAEIEQSIVQYAEKARTGGITLQDMQGGCFTITNGGIYGSLLSTPIINPPQSGILGMHSIQERPVAVNGEVVIRPMMYTALSYDHRVVDGKEAVTFLVKLKEAMEDPARLALGI
ncbi:MAG: 2-oxoglutarate dehydrogenase complex dihydrolipoyllysine-residue succinyltransferase [Opitutae bacterium]|jgi:2-oxoglutarate dehydrogenase E2 component (dihydrolipoamide succinyltransferase)|nr:2-oxoglutarate dehydrogenase complex dihydrolipoyllysine-residue succinyltransferase [Opitutae bacterium]